MPTDSTIKIKRSTGTTAPTAGTEIVVGELATVMDSTNNGASNVVYLGIQNSTGGTNRVAVGGKLYTDIIDNLTSFNTVAVSGQSNVVADSRSDTLTLAAGSGISITTNASTDTITIGSTLAGGTVTSITPAADNGNGTAITTSGTITVVGTANEITTSVSGNTITVGMPDNVTVGGALTVNGNLTVNGTTTTVNSTTITIDDPVFTLGGDIAPTADDNLDRGIDFRWHDGSTAKLGFMGWDDSAQAFAFWNHATNTSGVYSTAGTGGRGSLAIGSNIRLYPAGSDSAWAQIELGTGFATAKSFTLPDVNGTFVTTGNLTAITTTGTITSGTWNGTIIDPTYGGTGVNNGTKTITLGGNFTHTGAHTLGLTTSGNTSVTLPTTGTLATLAGTETLTGKTIQGGVFTGNVDAAGATQLIVPYGSGKSVSEKGGLVINSTNGLLIYNDALGTGTIRTVATTDRTETLSNKTLSSSSAAGSGFQFAGSSTGFTTVVAAATASGTLTLPATTGTFITTGNLTGITSTGTITSGTWNAGVISPTYGGTGVNNGSNTITLSGNLSTAGAFSTSGAFSTTLTATATTNVTLPTTGTLATLAGVETLTNKTIDGGTF